MRNLIADYVRKLPINLRTYVLPFIYGLFGGLAAVAFQKSVSTIFSIGWEKPSQQMSPGNFAFFSLAMILVASIISGLILTFVSPDAAGSGIPQAKIAFWRDFGFMPARLVIAKFFASAISIAGGCSLGREGPTVHIAGALASNIAGWLGIAKQGRRPALLSGAAAGLAAAFNTPLSAITFVLEEIIEDLNDRGFLAQVLIASVTATFVSHIFLGDDPAFVIPSIGDFSGILFLLVIPTAALAALAGVSFQKATLIWRDQIKQVKRIPFFLKPAAGALMNWVLGILVFFTIAKIGVFGLGYGDLQTMLHGGINGPQAIILVLAKLAATTAVYAWGGAGGIFSPTLFFGAAIGLAFSDLCGLALHLQPNDQIALTVAGMSACLGAVVRAPITSILIVFEMTHQFSFVPLLMIGTIASQAVSRALCQTNFYSEVIQRDGVELERHIPPRSLASLQSRPVSTLANFSPIFAGSTDRDELKQLCTEHPYQQFPLIMDGQLLGLIDRDEILDGQSAKIAIEPADAIPAHATIREAVAKMVGNSMSLLV
ncbi:MAG TPA: chloride channel protein, partial [Chthoniobacterales bacterium]|nr:chloride channel protein [Chthoniobacterales bacterium]